MDFTITLLSNADSRVFQTNTTNTLSTFSNYIQPAIPLGGNWEFALQSFFCHNQFKKKDAELIEIGCDLLSPISRQNEKIAIFARPKETDGQIKSVYYEPSVKNYFPVATNYISNVTVEIWTTKQGSRERNYRDLLGGQPTVVQLHFRPKNMYSPDFVVHVESDKAKNRNYPNNTAVDFRSDIGREFNFNPETSNLEVALSSITYKPEFQMTGELHSKVKQYNLEDTDKVILTKSIKPFSGVSLAQYMDYINKEVVGQFKTADNEILADFQVSRTEGKRVKLVSKTKCLIELPYSIMFNLGERSFIPIEGISEKDAGNYYSYKIYLDENHPYVFAAAPNPFAFYPDMAFVYCDFVRNNYIGNKSKPILKSFPINPAQADQDYVTFNVQNPEFYGVSKYDLSSVHFSLKDVSGDNLPFKNLDSNVIITLLIRDRNKYSIY